MLPKLAGSFATIPQIHCNHQQSQVSIVKEIEAQLIKSHKLGCWQHTGVDLTSKLQGSREPSSFFLNPLYVLRVLLNICNSPTANPIIITYTEGDFHKNP